MKVVMATFMLALMGISGYGVYWGWESHNEAGVVASGKGIPGVMNYVDSETTTTYVPITVGNTTTMMPQTSTNYYGKFTEAKSDKVLSDRAYISGDFNDGIANKAVFYNDTIYTDGGTTANVMAWVLMIACAITFIVGALMLKMVLED